VSVLFNLGQCRVESAYFVPFYLFSSGSVLIYVVSSGYGFFYFLSFQVYVGNGLVTHLSMWDQRLAPDLMTLGLRSNLAVSPPEFRLVSSHLIVQRFPNNVCTDGFSRSSRIICFLSLILRLLGLCMCRCGFSRLLRWFNSVFPAFFGLDALFHSTLPLPPIVVKLANSLVVGSLIGPRSLSTCLFFSRRYPYRSV